MKEKKFNYNDKVTCKRLKCLELDINIKTVY